MVDINSKTEQVRVNVSSVGNKGNVSFIPTQNYYDGLAKQWAISENIVNGEDYSSKHYAKESKKQANLATEKATIATNKTTEVIESGNEALSKISAQEIVSKNAVKTEGDTQVARVQAEGTNYATKAEATYTAGAGISIENNVISNTQTSAEWGNIQGDIQNQNDLKELVESKRGSLELFDIGISLYINETKGLRRWLNGSIMDITSNYQAFLARLKKITTLYPSLVCTETEWQAIKTASKLGQCGKFVYNYGSDGVTVTSVRLPAVVNINGLIDMAKAGLIKNESLPNITGHYNTAGAPSLFNNGTGVFKVSGTLANSPAASSLNDGYNDLTFDASHSSSTYQNNAPVQQEAIQYPYFIQVATGQETENNIVNDIELNNPFFFGKSEYFDEEPDNLSWLKSNGQNNPKGTYPDYYNWVLENVNKGTYKFKTSSPHAYTSNTNNTYLINSIAPVIGMSVYGYAPTRKCGVISALVDNGFTFLDTISNTEYTLYRDTTHDVSDIWLTDYDFEINTTGETFRLPLLNGEETIPSDRYVFNIIPNDITPTQQTYTAPANGWVYVKGYQITGGSIFANIKTPTEVETSALGAGTAVNSSFKRFVKRGDTLVVRSDGATFSKVNSYFQYAQGNGSLYYYVGETVQNANLIDAGRIGEILPTKLDASKVKAYIVETYQNGNSWYRLWSDNWCEQGGFKAALDGYGLTTVNLLKPYKDASYWISVKRNGLDDAWFTSATASNGAALTDIDGTVGAMFNNRFTTQKIGNHFWKAEGYIA